MSALARTKGDARDFAYVEDGQDESAPLTPYRTRVQADLERDVARRKGRCNFLDTLVFQVVVAGLLLLNVVVVSLQVAVHSAHDVCQLLDEVCFCFFAGELLCRIFHHGGRIFMTDKQDRFCNFLESGIVALGLLQIFVLPRVLAPQHAQYVGIFSFSRLFRITRMMRHMSFNWTENDWFQYLSGGVICLNAAVLGFETDSPNPAWWWVNQGILLFFVFEIVVRIRLEGCKGFFISEEDIFWNWMDFVIVLLGVFDLWAIPMGDLILGTKTSNGFGRLVLLVRMLRMLRILRLLKLVKAVRPLYSLALGVTQAMQSIFWVLVFLVVTLYAFAILATRLLGHSHFVQESDDLPVASKELFCSIWDSMFALFSIMNQQNWEAMGPLLDKVPAIKPVYVLFTICSSWALLSVLTGVVSDNMMAVRESQAQKDEEAVEERRIWLARWLRGVFAAADKDGSMALERSEYRELLKSPFHLKRLQQVAKVPMQDLMQMFDILDVDHNGLIEFQEFLVGFEWLNEPISGKSLLKLGHEIRVSCQAVEKLLHSLGGDLDRLCSRQLDQQTRLENKFREVVESRRRLKEECDKALMAQAKAYEARAELAGLMEQYKVITMSEADEDELHPEEDTLADMVIQTPTNKHQGTIISTSVLKTESLQAQTSGTEKRFDIDHARSKSTSKASSYAMMPEDNDVNPSVHTPLGMRTPLGGAGGARGRMMGRSMSRLDGG